MERELGIYHEPNHEYPWLLVYMFRGICTWARYRDFYDKPWDKIPGQFAKDLYSRLTKDK